MQRKQVNNMWNFSTFDASTHTPTYTNHGWMDMGTCEEQLVNK